MSETYRGPIDRIIDAETAVMLIEVDGEIVAEHEVPLAAVPAKAQRPGAMVEVTESSTSVERIVYDEMETVSRLRHVNGRLNRTLPDPTSE